MRKSQLFDDAAGSEAETNKDFEVPPLLQLALQCATNKEEDDKWLNLRGY